jgi:hypothetical protein
MAEPKITVEIEGKHTFELEPTGGKDFETRARSVFETSCVVEHRGDGKFTVYPVSQITAVYVGALPSRHVGFPSAPVS